MKKKLLITLALIPLFIVTSCSDSFRLDFYNNKDGENESGQEDDGYNIFNVGEEIDEGGDDGIDTNVYEAIQSKYNNLKWEYNGGNVTITMAHWNDNSAATEKAVINALLKGFYSRYPDIQVKVTYYNSYESTYGNKLVAGTADDVILVPDGAFSKWGATGKLKELQELIDTSEILDLSTAFETALTRYQLNPTTKRAGSGKQLALPKDIGPHVLYYNKDLIDEINTYASSHGMSRIDYPPNDAIWSMTTATNWWTNIKNLLSLMGRTNVYPMCNMSVEGLVWSAGGDFLNASRDGFPGNTQGLQIGYQYIRDAYYDYGILPASSVLGNSTPITFFTSGNCVSVLGERSDVSTLKNTSMNWGVAFVPSFTTGEFGVTNGNHEKNTYSGSVGYGIYSGCPNNHYEAAWKLVEYISSKEGQEILSSTGYQIPVYNDLALDSDVVQREVDNGVTAEEYKVFVDSAATQSYGLWQYRQTIEWKEKTYDKFSENLLHSNPSVRASYTVTSFLNDVQNNINKYLG